MLVRKKLLYTLSRNRGLLILILTKYNDFPNYFYYNFNDFYFYSSIDCTKYFCICDVTLPPHELVIVMLILLVKKFKLRNVIIYLSSQKH